MLIPELVVKKLLINFGGGSCLIKKIYICILTSEQEYSVSYWDKHMTLNDT